MTVHEPRSPNSQVMVCGSLIQAMTDSDPDRITSPARNGMPSRPRVLASQATALTGEPCTAAPAPVANTSASPPAGCTVMAIPTSARSTSKGSIGWSPSTYTPHEALSATVSTILMSQSLTRESTISKHGTT